MSILQMSIQAGLLILVIIVLRAVALNKLPKTMFLVLWAVALMRLLIPFSISSPFSIYSVANTAIISAEINVPTAIYDVITPVTNNAVQPQMSVPTEAAAALNISTTTIIWLAGILMLLAFFVVSYVKTYRQLRDAIPVTGNAFLDKWKAEHKLMRPLSVLQSDRVTTPLAVGLIKPRVILPKSMNMDDTRLVRYVLTHEYFHIRRFDMLWKMLMLCAVCLHWFNPLVWVMFVLVNRDLEITCDEKVVHHFGATDKSTYAYSLIGMAEQRSKFSPLYSGFSKNAAEERITAIMKIKKTSMIGIVMALVLVAGVTGAFATSALGNSGGTSAEPVTLTDDLSTQAAASVKEIPLIADGEPIPEDAVFIELENEDNNTGFQFNPENNFAIQAFELTSGTYVTSDASYKINSGDILMVGATWVRMGLDIQVGFVDANDSTIQYWSSLQSGGSLNYNGTEAIDTSGIPSGEYYVCVNAPQSNVENIEQITAVFGWK